MNRIMCLFFIVGLIILGVQPVLAQEESAAAEPFAETAAEAADTAAVGEAVSPPETAVTETPADAAPAEAEPALAAEPAGAAAADATETATSEQPSDAAATATEQPPEEQQEIPYRIRNNRYFRESQRYAKLAEDTYAIGDYDASTGFADEAIRYARLSDEYVALQMKIKAANDAIAAAKTRIDWAVSSGASTHYPAEFSEAEGWYGESLAARKNEEWDNAIEAARKVINILAYIEAPGEAPEPATYADAPAEEVPLPLPARYTVRTWDSVKDCLWNIAGRPWAYGDSSQWRVLYNANKAKLPEPQNADLIEPGMVIEIPSLKGEARQGEWDETKTYTPLN